MDTFLKHLNFWEQRETNVDFYIRTFDYTKIYVSKDQPHIYLVQSDDEINLGKFTEEKILNLIKILA
jgi:hypothetical protein